MSDFIKFAFAAGVMSPTLYSRGDLEKFDLGLAEGSNWFVDYRGGASTRAGTQFYEFVKNDDNIVRLTSFQFNSELANTYTIVFGEGYIRFMQGGSYVLSSTSQLLGSYVGGDTSATVTAVGHTYAVGDWFRCPDDLILSAIAFEITATTAGDITFKRVDGGIIPAFAANTVSAVVYEIANPYDPADFFALHFEQSQNEVVITHTKYAPSRLERIAADNWTLTEIDYTDQAVSPANLTTTPEVAGTSGALFGVTAIDIDGRESLLKSYSIEEQSNLYSLESGSVLCSWDAVADTDYYNVYRSLLLSKASDLTLGEDMGLLGSTFTTTFTDTNIIPDYTFGPPRAFEPFTPGTVLHVNITASGSGYAKTGNDITAPTGTGLVAYGVGNAAGEIQSALLVQGGRDYIDGDTITVGGAGAGATGTIVASPLTGTYPQCSIRHQQRRIYAGTENAPMSIIGSRIGEPDSFDRGSVVTSAGPYFLNVDSREQTPIKYLEAGQTGLFVFTASDVWQLRGQDDTSVTADTGIISILTETGIANVPPLKIEREVIYVQNESVACRALKPSNLPTYYVDADLSLFSNHFFLKQNKIKSWAFAKDPHRLIWCVREDGSTLSFTYVPEQNVYAWTDHFTLGEFKDVSVVKENGTDQPYFLVQRDGKQYIEGLAERLQRTVETMWAVDAGIALLPQDHTEEIQFTEADGVITVTAASAVFTSGDVGKHLRSNGGRMLVTEYVSATVVKGTPQIPLTFRNKSTGELLISTDWSLGALFGSVSGLDHLEGKTVQILADGTERAERTVVDGTITFQEGEEASLVIVGLGFTATLQTLPLTAQDQIIEDKPKNVTSLAVRLYESRGVWAGATESDVLYEMKERTTERYGTPITFVEGMHEISVRSGWERDGSATIEKRGPFNITLLGMVMKTEIGDA